MTSDAAADRLAPIHHVGYVVDELSTAVPRFAAAFGAGPFFAMHHIRFDEVSFRDGPATYDHSSAFGAWGSMLVELTEVHTAEPAGLRDRLVDPGGGVGHVAWLADSLEAEVERLQSLGLVAFHAGRTGPACAVWFERGPLLGHAIEVLQRRDELLGFYALVVHPSSSLSRVGILPIAQKFLSTCSARMEVGDGCHQADHSVSGGPGGARADCWGFEF